MSNEILRKYIDIIKEHEILDEEILEEGMLQKLAGLALGTVLALGPKIGQAETVYSYLPSNQNMILPAMQLDHIPDDARVILAVDTDSKQVKVIKGSMQGQTIQPDPASVKQGQQQAKQPQIQQPQVQQPQAQQPQAQQPQAAQPQAQQPQAQSLQQAGNPIIGSIQSGLTPEQIVANNPGFKIVKPKLTNLGPIGKISNNFGISKNTVKAEGQSTSPYKTQSATFVTFDKNNKSDGVAYQIKLSSLPKEWQDKGLLGYNRGQVENLVKEIIRNAPSELGTRTGKIKFRDSEGQVIGGTTIGYGSGGAVGGGVLGIGSSLNLFSTKISDFVIIQDFENGKLVIPFIVTDDKYYEPDGNNMFVYVKDPNSAKDDLEFEPEYKNK